MSHPASRPRRRSRPSMRRPRGCSRCWRCGFGHDLADSRPFPASGPGGMKPRLAARAASEARRAFLDGVWLLGLASLRDPVPPASEVARGAGLLDQPTRWAVATQSEHLAGWRALIVLDWRASTTGSGCCRPTIRMIPATGPWWAKLAWSYTLLPEPGAGMWRRVPTTHLGGSGSPCRTLGGGQSQALKSRCGTSRSQTAR